MLPGNKLAALIANTQSQFKDNLHQTNQHSLLMQFTALYILLWRKSQRRMIWFECHKKFLPTKYSRRENVQDFRTFFIFHKNLQKWIKRVLFNSFVKLSTWLQGLSCVFSNLVFLHGSRKTNNIFHQKNTAVSKHVLF